LSMFFWQNNLSRRTLRLIDLFIVLVSYLMAMYVKAYALGSLSGLARDANHALVLILLLIFNNFTLNFFDLYDACGKGQCLKRVVKTALALAISTSLLIFCMYFLRINNIGRLLLMLYNGFALCLLLGRQFYFTYRLNSDRQDENERINVLVVGSRERARDVIRNILRAKNAPYNILGCLDTDSARVGRSVQGQVRVIGTIEEYEQILLGKVVDEVIFALPLYLLPRVQERIAFAENAGVNIRIMPDWQIQRIMFRPETASISFDNLAGLPLLSLSSTPKKEVDLLLKNLFDYLVAVAGLVLLSPLFLVIAAAIKLTSPGPVFFRSERCGLNGRRFSLYKFRTMVENAEELKKQLQEKNEMDGPVFKIRDDPRVTRVGRFLRKTSLDELPQLINVARGHMSLVGPRPPLPEEVAQYTPVQRRRLSMKPGMTCIWQVSGRNDVSFDRWMKMDLKYIDNWSLLLDFKLLFLTMRAVFEGTGR